MTPVLVGSSPTEAEIRALQAYIDEGGCRAAARKLGVAESTIKNHLLNARSRLGARTNAELVLRLHDRLAA